jgi:hypothetical protein
MKDVIDKENSFKMGEVYKIFKNILSLSWWNMIPSSKCLKTSGGPRYTKL